MILYQKPRTNYIVRTFFSGMTILGLVFTAAVVVIAYFAVQAPWPQTFGIWLLAAFVALAPYAIFRGMLKTNMRKIVLVEIIPNALRILELNKNEEEETIIPSHNLQIDIITHISSSHTSNGLLNRQVSYRLEILGKDNEKPPFRIYESKRVLAEMLEKIEESQIIPLKLNEKDLINSYRNPGVIGSLINFRKYFLIAAIIVAVIFMGAKIFFFGSMWFSTTENVFPATWNVITSEGDSTGYLLMKSDSTFLFRGFNSDCSGSFSKIAATIEEPGKIKLFATDNTTFLFPLYYNSEIIELTEESSLITKVLYKAGFYNYEDNAELTRESDGKVFQLSRTPTKEQ
ncbi:MAG TPA: hypothetical protein VMV47_17445 [Bacteroidales bacterium]|nr:hypothetical protein [Bacteroidales bacterium]